MKLSSITMVYAILLILLGLIGFFAFGRTSFTALIPAFLGVLVLIAGWLARDEKLRRSAMHAAAALSLLGFLGAVSGVMPTVKLIAGAEIVRPAAAISKTIMSLLSLAFLILCVNSFIQARRKT